MNKLDQEATKIFLELLDILHGRNSFEIKPHGYISLSIKFYSTVITPLGQGKLYGLSHTRTKNYKIIREPEMRFIVIDHREKRSQIEKLSVYPQLFADNSFDQYEISVVIEKFRAIKFDYKVQLGHCRYANKWMRDLERHGFLY